MGKIKEKYERVSSKIEANEKAPELQHELKPGEQKLFDGDRLTFREVAEEYMKRHVTEAQYVGKRKVKGSRSGEDTRSKILV